MVLIFSAQVEGSVTLSVNGTENAEELVVDGEVTEGWRRAIAEIAGTPAASARLDPPPFVLERRLGFARGLAEEADNLSEAVNLSEVANQSSPLTAKLAVPYVIIVPADSEDRAANLSSLLAASIMSASPAELTESIARHVSETTGGADYHIVVDKIEVPTFGVVTAALSSFSTSTALEGSIRQNGVSSFAYPSMALHLGQAMFLAAITLSVV